MLEDKKLKARNEIRSSLSYCNFFLRRIGLSFIDDVPNTFNEKLIVFLSFVIASTLLILMVVGQYAYIAYLLVNNATLEQLIGSYLHIAGYDTMSFGKLLTIWYKQNSFRQVVNELADIWPVSEEDKEAVAIKDNSLTSLRRRQAFFFSLQLLVLTQNTNIKKISTAVEAGLFASAVRRSWYLSLGRNIAPGFRFLGLIAWGVYLFWNVLGVWLYNLTPVVIHLYRLARGMSSDLGYVWQMYYPFDKTKPFVHEFVYIFETFAGVASVCCMLGSDVFFISMANHISLLLRLLQERIRQLGMSDVDAEGVPITGSQDCYDQIVGVIKIHQRLISYANDLEDAFSVVNLINVLLSSVNICCVVFSIVFLESWMEMSNKFFLGAAMTQMGIVCWYADDIYRASMGVSDAVYESGWYRCNTRCRRALLATLQRSQKPLYFTALKFKTITMITYTSILTTSYSYFTLLYTSYRRD